MDLKIQQLIYILIGFFTAVLIQGGMVLGGCKLAGIRKATYLDSLIITVKCWGLSIILLPLLGLIPIVGVIFNIIGHFLIPTLVIKGKYRVQMEKAFWAAFGYLSISLLAMLGTLFFLSDKS